MSEAMFAILKDKPLLCMPFVRNFREIEVDPALLPHITAANDASME